VVGVFGPSDPVRYAPRDPLHQIVRVDLPCSPCNRIRLPPERCIGHTPDCLTSVDVEMVYRAVEQVLTRSRRPAARLGAARG
jgi:ADP-heptose:LPS heptosyltransferase